MMGEPDDPFPWHLGVFDAHCHPTDTLNSLDKIPHMRARVLTIMATRAQDQALVADAANRFGVVSTGVSDLGVNESKDQKLLPSFGWHPWFSYQMFDENDYDHASQLDRSQKIRHYQEVLVPKSDDVDFLLSLPEPRPLGHFIEQTKTYLKRYSFALVGEVGLDRAFRIPDSWLPEQLQARSKELTPGGREGRKLSPYRVSMDHQRKVFLAQLRLAGEMQRAVSVHGVQAHGIVYETIAETWKGHERRVLSKRERKKEKDAMRMNANDADAQDHASNIKHSPASPFPPRICLHSFSGPAELVKQYIHPSGPCEVYFSFSTTINNWSEGTDGKVEEAVRAVPDDRILIESDLHTAGDEMDEQLQNAVRKICQTKAWSLDEGVELLGRNWRNFAFGRR